jgi:hypothetical protein
MRPLSERTARLTIGMMRSMANCKPISPFHLNASHEMEQLLKEVLEYRKEKKPRKWVGLTKAERSKLWWSTDTSGMPEHDYGKALEAKLKEKNNE